MPEPDRRWAPPGLDQLPDGWRWVALEEVAEIDPRVQRPPSGASVRVVPMAAVDSDTGQIEALETALVDEAPRHLRAFLGGDVLLAKISPSFENGKVAVAEEMDLAGLVGLSSSEFHVLRPGNRILARYLWLILRQDRARAHLVPTMKGRAGQQRIAPEALGRLPIPLPPSPAEQAAVVMKAVRAEDHYRQARAHAEGARAATERVRDAILADVTFSAAPWGSAALADLVPKERPIRYGIVQPGPEHPGGVPYVRVRDFEDGSIALAGLGHTDPAIAERHRAAVLRSGDLLVSIRGTVGRVARVADELDGAHTTQDAARISGLDPVLREWVALLISRPAGREWLQAHTSGRAVQGVNVTDLRRMPVPLPPREEMARRVRLAEAALPLVTESELSVESAVARLERIRETATLAIALGQPDAGAVPLLPEPELARAKEEELSTGLASAPEPVAVADDAPPLVQAVAASGGRIDASDLLGLKRQMPIDDFYEQLWEAVEARWLLEPPPGSSTLELADAP